MRKCCAIGDFLSEANKQKMRAAAEECGFEAVAYEKSAPHFDTSDLTDWEIRQVQARLENLDIKKGFLPADI